MGAESAIFAIDGADVTAFADRDRAGQWLEAYDIDSGAMRVFKSDGTELRPRIEGRRVIVTDDAAGKHPDVLAEALRGHIRAVSATRRTMDEASIDRASLPELVEETVRIERICESEPP
jgi:hypothetical protein